MPCLISVGMIVVNIILIAAQVYSNCLIYFRLRHATYCTATYFCGELWQSKAVEKVIMDKKHHCIHVVRAEVSRLFRYWIASWRLITDCLDSPRYLTSARTSWRGSWLQTQLQGWQSHKFRYDFFSHYTLRFWIVAVRFCVHPSVQCILSTDHINPTIFSMCLA